MSKLLFALFAVSLAACNSSSTETKSGDSASKAPAANISNMSAAELAFIDDCVESSKASLGEAKAYTMCKCILPQVEAKYPALGEEANKELQKDTAAMIQMAKACE